MKKKLISALLTLTMALSLFPASALAVEPGNEPNLDEQIESRTGETSITASTTNLINGTYILDGPITLTGEITVPNAVTATIDLNGQTLTAASGKRAIYVAPGGILTIKDSQGGGKITQNDSDNQYVVQNSGTLNFNSGEINSSAITASALANRSADATKVAHLTINGGTVNAKYIAIKNDRVSNGNAEPQLTISGGVIAAGNDQVIQNWGTANISAGAFSGCVGTWTDGSAEIGKTIITGGTFDLKNSAIKPGAVIALFLYTKNTSGAGAKVAISGNVTVNGSLTLNGEKSQVPVVGVAYRPDNGGKNEYFTTLPTGATFNVSGGTYSNNPFAESTCVEPASGTGSVEQDGMYKVGEVATVTFDTTGASGVTVVDTNNTEITSPVTVLKKSDLSFKLSGVPEGQVAVVKNGTDTINDTDGVYKINVTANTVISVTLEAAKYTVTFDSKEGSEVAAQDSIAHGSTVQKPIDPTRDGYTFGGWCTDEACTTPFDFATKITRNLTLYAKWTQPIVAEPEVSNDGTATATVEIPTSGVTANEPVTIDATPAADETTTVTSTEVTVPAAAVTALEKASSVEIETAIGTVELPKETIEEIGKATATASQDAVLTVAKADEKAPAASGLDEGQEVEATFEVTVTVGNDPVLSEAAGKNTSLTLTFRLNKNLKNPAVYYVKSDKTLGEKLSVVNAYDPTTGEITVKAPHLSVFAVVADKQTTGDVTMTYVKNNNVTFGYYDIKGLTPDASYVVQLTRGSKPEEQINAITSATADTNGDLKLPAQNDVTVTLWKLADGANFATAPISALGTAISPTKQ